MTKEEIIKAVDLATGGSYIGPGVGCCTCMGWIPEYDAQGRCVSCDPNYHDSSITIEGETFHLTRCGWTAVIWDSKYPDASYGWMWKENFEQYAIAVIDLEPDYVKAYRKAKAQKLEKISDAPKPSEEEQLSAITYLKDTVLSSEIATLEAQPVECQAVLNC